MATWFKRFKNYFSGDGQSSSGGVVFVDRASSQVTRGSREILELYHHSPWLRSVVSKIATHSASVPWKLYRVHGKSDYSNDTSRMKPKTRILRDLRSGLHFQRAAVLKNGLKNDAIEELDNHPFLSLWDKANPRFGGNRLRQLTQKYLDLVGEFFWIIERDANNIPVELWPIPPTWVKNIPIKAEDLFEVSWGKEKRFVKAQDIIWFCDDNLQNPYGRGKGTALSLSDELDSDEYAAQLIKTAFENRGLLDLVISVEGAKQEQLDRARSEFENRHKGWLKAGVPLFHSGKADVKVVSQSFSEMQLLQLREWERDTIISIYGVPPELLGVLGKSNRATITESREIMASEVIIPRLEYMRNVLNNTLVSQFGSDLVIDFEDPSPGSEEFQLRAMQAHPYSITEREWRKIQGLEDRGERDEFVLLPAGLYPFRGSVGSIQPPQTTESSEEPVTPIEDSRSIDTSGSKTKVEAKAVEPKRVNEVVEGIIEAVTPDPFVETIVPLFREEMISAAEQELEDIQKEGKAYGKLLSKSIVRKAVEDIYGDVSEYLETYSSKRIVGLINKTTRNQLKATLIEGVEAGESIRELSTRVGEVFEVSKGRATSIARTEILRAQNYSTYSAQKASGLIEEREWISTLDDRTRDSHLNMNSIVVGIDKPFQLISGPNAGAIALHPGDFDIAEEDVQCRCTTAGVIVGRKNASPRSPGAPHTQEQVMKWKAFDDRFTKWEQKAIPKIQTAFEIQYDTVLDALKKAMKTL